MYHYKFTTRRIHDEWNQKALCNEVGNRDIFQRIKICDWISLLPFKKGGVYHAGNLCAPDSLQLLWNYHDECGNSSKRYKTCIPDELHNSNSHMQVFSAEWYFSTWCWEADTKKPFTRQTWAIRPSQSQTQVSGEFSVSGSLTSTKVYRFFRQMTICLFVLSESSQTIFKTKK